MWLWMRSDRDRLPSPVRRTIARSSHRVYLSVVCATEIAIKQAAGTLRLDVSLREWVESAVGAGAILMPLTVDHAVALAALPVLHRDPFDRMLVAQAKVEDVTLVTADARILKYDVATIDARK